MLKPTYLNMDIPMNDLAFSEICNADSLNLDAISHFFGNNLDWDWIKNIRIDSTIGNRWGWGPTNHCASIVSSVYSCHTTDGSFKMLG